MSARGAYSRKYGMCFKRCFCLYAFIFLRDITLNYIALITLFTTIYIQRTQDGTHNTEHMPFVRNGVMGAKSSVGKMLYISDLKMVHNWFSRYFVRIHNEFRIRALNVLGIIKRNECKSRVHISILLNLIFYNRTTGRFQCFIAIGKRRLAFIW